MNILGIDWGVKKIGLALGTSFLAEPLAVIKAKDSDTAIEKIEAIVEREKIEKIVVGISESESAGEAKKFGEKLKAQLGIMVDFEDETLTTSDAQALSLKANISRKKRHELEDAYAACVMLQSYLDKHA